MSVATRGEEESLEPRRLRRVLVGRPMRTGQMHETLLPKWLALPIFASDPLSSVAYATEEALVVLVGAAGIASLHLVFPLSIAIACLLAIVVLSYRQTVRVYETSGGAYIVARENLGTAPSLVAAAALLTDYVLTVAVSISAGIFAITSFVPSLASHRVGLSLACLLVIVLANLRGVRESGLLFALPTYAFIAAIVAVDAVGIVQYATGHLHRAVVPSPIAAGTGAVTLFILLRAFSSGSTALTGVEAIANGVNAFRHPQGKNAAKTLAILGVTAIAMFLGVSFLAVHVHAAPSNTASVVSQIARAVFQPGSTAAFMFYVVQGTTLLILILAANTSFQGFPRLSALLARDRFAPRQFSNLGDRLVFSNGMLVLAGAAAGLLAIYKANTNSLIHLYVIGVFTAFTVSQAGMVRYWRRVRSPGWRGRSLINGVGAAATGLVTVIVIWTKFAEGAWLVTVAIPVLVVGSRGGCAREQPRSRPLPTRGTGRCSSSSRSGRRRNGLSPSPARSRRTTSARSTPLAAGPIRESRRAGSAPQPGRRSSRRSTHGPERSRRCSSRSGGYRAESRTSSPSSSPSSSAGAPSSRRRGIHSSSASSSGFSPSRASS
jgi:amino acid transporter